MADPRLPALALGGHPDRSESQGPRGRRGRTRHDGHPGLVAPAAPAPPPQAARAPVRCR